VILLIDSVKYSIFFFIINTYSSWQLSTRNRSNVLPVWRKNNVEGRDTNFKNKVSAQKLYAMRFLWQMISMENWRLLMPFSQ